MATYSLILKKLSENTKRISTYRTRAMDFLFGKYGTKSPLDIPIKGLFSERTEHVIHNLGIRTVGALLQYALENGWHSLKQAQGLGVYTYREIINTLYNTNFINVGKDKSITLAPEIAALVM